MKPKKLGSVNPCGIAVIKTTSGKQIAETIDTPNAIAYAFKVLPESAYADAFYPMFGDSRTLLKDVKNRIAFVNKEEHGEYLKIY